MKSVADLRQREGWLRSSHSFKECVTAHPPRLTALRMDGTKKATDTLDLERDMVKRYLARAEVQS